MLIVGLTGNIGSGKSTVSQIWRSRGARIIDADELARTAVAPGSRGLARVVDRWGASILGPSGDLNRAALRDLVFRDPRQRRELESIVHPEVRRLRDEAVKAAEDMGLKLVVADIPLLFEAGLEAEFERVVLVEADPDQRLDRLVRTRGITPAEAKRMIDAQLPSERKRARSDYIINNSDSLEGLERRALSVWTRLEQEVREKDRVL